MSESPDQTVLNEPGERAITDSFGNAWRITPSGRISANGVLDSDDRAQVIQLYYRNGMVWRQMPDLHWQTKRHPSDSWLPAQHSPLTGPVEHEVDEIEGGVAEVLEKLKQLRDDLDVVQDRQLEFLKAIAALSALITKLPDTTAIVVLLQEILAIVRSLVPPPPVRIFLDFKAAVPTPQPVPSRPGP